MSSEMLREVTRRAVRAEAVRQAWNLFAEQGFENTTIDQIVDAAGMSRRTFFRYFSGKDELVLERMIEAGEGVAGALAARPADEPLWWSLRSAFDEVVIVQEQNSDVARRLRRMLNEEPSLKGIVEEWRRRWIGLLAPIVAERIPPASGPDARAEALTASALACLETAQIVWIRDPEARLGVLLDDAMNFIQPLRP
jgi:AcrR family transcriptional regulator